MINLPTSDKTNGFQKFIAFGLMGAVVWAGIKAFNYMAPTLIELMKNIWWLVGLGTPLALIVLYVVSNPLVIWGFFKTISWKLTSWLINMDSLSVMDRYADYLTKKLRNLNSTKTQLNAKKIDLRRSMVVLQQNITDNLKKGDAAIQLNRGTEAAYFGTMVRTDENTLKLYQPIYERMVKNLEFLDELSENWDFSIKQLRYTIDGKRKEYVTLKATAAALNQAKEFASGDSDARRLYDESVKALEENVSRKIAAIDEFEKTSKTVMGTIRIEKKMIQDEGLKAIEAYRKNGELLLPDFSKVGESIAYEDVSNSSKNNFNL